ncbi:MAG: transposase [Lachnospiraceae bacterium]|nr:transposase [Lachnospiraceae bacterium]
MANEDEVLARYLSNDERYADLINGIGFGGRQVVQAADLSERDTKTGYHKGNRAVKGKNITKYRDLFRRASFGANFAVIGVENQKQVHYLMPVRCLEYDLKEYQRQEVELSRKCKNQTPAEFLSGFPKSGKLHPCITIVLYYGDDWDGSTDLYGLLDFTNIPEELKNMVGNYKINLLDIKKLENTEMFHTDIKQVFDFIRCSGNKDNMKKLITTEAGYKSLSEDAYGVMAAFTKSKELMQLREKQQEGERVDMCKALQEWAAEERSEGRAEGRAEGLAALVKTLSSFITDEEALYRTVISNELYQETEKEAVLKYLAEYI